MREQKGLIRGNRQSVKESRNGGTKKGLVRENRYEGIK